MPQPPKEKAPEMGSKKRAGNLLSSFLRAIAQEQDKSGVCKAEALARLIWNKALGYKEVVEDADGVEVTITNDPDKDMIKLVYDRMEGKVSNAEETSDRERSLPDKVSDTNRDRLNKDAEKIVG